MFTWKKLGRILNPSDIKDSWIKEYAQAPSAIVFGNYVRVYFSSRYAQDSKGQFVSRLAYIDLDRDNLLKIINICESPILALGDLGTFDEFGTYPVSVIRTGDDIRAYYAGWTRCESVPFNAAIGLAFSKNNGASFEKAGKGPVLSYSPDEPFVLGSPKIRKFNDTWYLWYSSGKKWIKTEPKPEPVYKIRMAVSHDGVNWKKFGKDLIEDILDEDECQASADVFFFKGVYHMFFSFRNLLSKVYKIGYASSTDLHNWTRNDLKAGISTSKTGWDSDAVSYPFVFELDDKVFMLHQGNEIGRNGFGLAELESYKQGDQ